MRRDTSIEIGRTYAGVLVAVRVALWRPSTVSRVIVMSVLGEHQCHTGVPICTFGCGRPPHPTLAAGTVVRVHVARIVGRRCFL